MKTSQLKCSQLAFAPTRFLSLGTWCAVEVKVDLAPRQHGNSRSSPWLLVFPWLLPKPVSQALNLSPIGMDVQWNHPWRQAEDLACGVAALALYYDLNGLGNQDGPFCSNGTNLHPPQKGIQRASWDWWIMLKLSSYWIWFPRAKILALCRWVLLETLWLQSWGLQLEQMQETALCTVEANRSTIAALEYTSPLMRLCQGHGELHVANFDFAFKHQLWRFSEYFHELLRVGPQTRNGMRRFLAWGLVSCKKRKVWCKVVGSFKSGNHQRHRWMAWCSQAAPSGGKGKSWQDHDYTVPESSVHRSACPHRWRYSVTASSCTGDIPTNQPIQAA